MREPFESWLPDVVADEIVVAPENIGDEAQGNFWSFSLSSEQALAVTVADLEKFLKHVIEARRLALQLRGMKAGAMRFYCWHDDQAAQLRLSLVSTSHGRLPFGGKIVETDYLNEVLLSFLLSPYHDGVPMSELREVGSDENELNEKPISLRVWSAEIP